MKIFVGMLMVAALAGIRAELELYYDSRDGSPKGLYECYDGTCFLLGGDFDGAPCTEPESAIARIDSEEKNELAKGFLGAVVESYEADPSLPLRGDVLDLPVAIDGIRYFDESGEIYYAFPDGTAMTFTDFKNGEVPENDGQNGCIGMDPASDYQWVGIACDYREVYELCEILEENIEIIG